MGSKIKLAMENLELSLWAALSADERFNTDSNELNFPLDHELNRILMENLQKGTETTANGKAITRDAKSSRYSRNYPHGMISPLNYQRAEMVSNHLDKVDKMLDQLSGKRAENELDVKNACDINGFYSTLQRLKNLELEKPQIPEFIIAQNISDASYFDLVKQNQNLLRTLFKLKQDIEFFSLQKNYLVGKLSRDEFGAKEADAQFRASNYSEKVEPALSNDVLPRTFTSDDDFEQSDTSGYNIRDHLDEKPLVVALEITPDNKENHELVSSKKLNSPVRKNLQSLFKSKRVQRENKLRKINDNLFADHVYDTS